MINRCLACAYCSLSLVIVTTQGHAQGTMVFNNLRNTDTSLMAQTNGLAFLNLSLLNQDISFILWAGPNFAELQKIHTWLVVDGSAKGIATGSGHFADPSGEVFSVPGVAPGNAAAFSITAWAGNYPDLLSAMDVGATYTGGNGAPPGDLSFMGALGVGPTVPEPSALSIGFAGALAFALKRRRGATCD